MLQIPAEQRLAYILAVMEEENIRFPNALLEKETKFDSGNISKMMSGKIPVSDNFFTEFLRNHSKVPQAWKEQMQPMGSGGLRRTLKDYVEHIEGENKFLKRLVDSALSDISISVKELVKRRINSAEVQKSSGTGQAAKGADSDLLMAQKLGGKSEVPSLPVVPDKNPEEGKSGKEPKKKN